MRSLYLRYHWPQFIPFCIPVIFSLDKECNLFISECNFFIWFARKVPHSPTFAFIDGISAI